MNSGEILNQLKMIDWDGDISPLADFLNLSQDELVGEYKSFEGKGDLKLAELQFFQENVTYILESLLAEKNREKIQEILTAEWKKADHIVEVEGKGIYTSVSESDDFLDNAWLDFICFFLYRAWSKNLAKCVVCSRWFYRKRSDALYCGRTCRNKRDYYKHQEKRTTRRRQKYRRLKE